MPKTGIIFLFIIAFFLSCASVTPLHAQNYGYSAEGIEKLRSDIQKILDEENIPGASIALVSKDGTIWAGGVGKADVAANKDVDANSLFRVGSISKSFTALSLLTLVEKGLLDLNTPVRDIAPNLEFTNKWSDTDPITVAMAMEHTTGFDDISMREYAKTDDPDMTLEEGLAYNPSSRVSRWKPGTHMSYANSGPPIAALVLEKITGQDFEEYAEENIFKRLDMGNSAYHFPVEADLLSKGYEDDGETEANYDHIIVRPSGALNASASDMSNYLQMMINRGMYKGQQLFKPETIMRMETPTTTLAARAGHDFGYGLGNYSSVVAGHHFHGHDGGITGFVSTSAYSSELGLGYFVSINSLSGKLRDIAELVGEFLIANNIPPVAPEIELAQEQLEEISGYYQNVTPRQQLMAFITRFMSIQKISVEDGKLFAKAQFGGEKEELIPVSEDSFRKKDQPVATSFRVADQDGNIYMQGSMGGNLRQISAFWAWFQPIAAALVVLTMLSTILFALVWVPAKAFGKMKSIPLGSVLPQLLAPLALFATLTSPMWLDANFPNDLGVMSPASLSIFLGTLMFAALTLYLLFIWFRTWGATAGGKLRTYSVFVTLACTVTMIYLWSNDILGIRLWAV
jgi:CubicO group peptidase (beta-lactamase class C family)